MPPISNGGNFQKEFVNRNTELKLIEGAFETLVDKDRLLGTPIIDFFGTNGIGKSSILKKIQELCTQKKISYIWIDEEYDSSNYARNILSQVQGYALGESTILNNKYADLFDQSVEAIKSLLMEKPVVVLLDAIDTTNEQQIDWIETMLHDLIENPNLFVILASKQEISFEQNWSMSRKLTPLQVKPLDRNSSAAYLDTISNSTLSLESRKSVFEWTCGYPLAMNVMVEAMQTQQLDPQKLEDQGPLVDIIMQQVVDQHVLSGIEATSLQWYKTYLSLLSLPRRFNLIMLQSLVERFEPTLALETRSRMEYMGLPRKINQNTNVLHWDVQKTGFTVDGPVRNIFFLHKRIQQPELFYAIHAFLAELNKHFAHEVSGNDRVRYLREYLYHRVYSQDTSDLSQDIAQILPQIIHTHDAVTQFAEELSQDKELKAVLGDAVMYITSFLNSYLQSEG